MNIWGIARAKSCKQFSISVVDSDNTETAE